LPLFQMIGKNVGIRRARGRFVLATNVDILLDDATVLYLRDRLRSGTVLRVDRYDVPGNLRLDVPFDQILSQCAQSFFHVNVRFGVFDVRQRRILSLGMGPIARLINLATEMRILGLQHMRLWDNLRSPALLLRRLPARVYKITKTIIGRVLENPAKWLSRLIRVASGLVGYVTGLLGPKNTASARYHRLRWLHTNACGDFTLLSRDDWARLRGYPEWEIYSWHLDSVFMYAASVHDVSEVAMGANYRIYHLDHSSGSGWSPEGAALLFERLDVKGIPYLSDGDLERWRLQVAAEPQSAIINDLAWGLGDQQLPERQVVPRLPKSLRQEMSL
jgi:hypothetical protein